MPEGDSEQVYHHQPGTLTAHIQTLRCEIMQGRVDFPKFEQHVEQTLDHHVTMLLSEVHIPQYLTELQCRLPDHHLVQLFRVLEVAVGWEVVSHDRLGQKSQPNGVGYLVRLMIAGDGVIQHSSPDDAGLPVVGDETRNTPEGGDRLDRFRFCELLEDLHLGPAELEPHVKCIGIPL